MPDEHKSEDMEASFKTLLGDPALSAMGLVPAGQDGDARTFADNPILPSWRTAWIMLGAAIVSILIVFRATAGQIVAIWYGSTTFNHGFLILPICGYLIWLKRGALSNRAPQPWLWGCAVILTAGAAWLIGNLGSVALIKHFALVLMIQGLFLTILGVRITRLLLFPLCYLFFAVPFGNFLVPPLQDLTAEFVVAGLSLLHIPVFHDGTFISIPSGNFLVAEACSGVRFLIATLALGFLFAHLTYTSLWRKAAFLCLSVIVPVIANGFRAFGIVLLAHLTNNAVAVRADHIIYGWIFFSIVTIVLLLIGMTFRDRQPRDETPDRREMHDAAAGAAAPRKIVLAAFAAILAGLASPAYTSVVGSRTMPTIHGPLPTPMPSGGWHLAGVTRDSWSPVFPGAHTSLLRTYVKNGHEVQLFVAYYASQRQGAELIGSENKVADGTAWSRAASGMSEVVVSGRTRSVRRVRMVGPTGRRIAYEFYWISGQVTGNAYVAKFLQARHMLFGTSEAGAAIVISTEYSDTPREADAVLHDFAANLAPLDSWLGRYARAGAGTAR